MFGIGWTEFVLVALVLLIFVGPKHLPDMLKKFGRIMGELRAASRELRNQLDVEMRDLESPSKIMHDVAKDISDSIPSPYDNISKAEEAVEKEVREIVDETVAPESEESATNNESEESATNNESEESATNNEPEESATNNEPEESTTSKPTSEQVSKTQQGDPE